MPDRRHDIITKLAVSGQNTASYFRALDETSRQLVVYSEGDTPWRARDLLAHLVTIERSMHVLFDNLLAGGPGTGEDFDLDRFNRGQVRKLADADYQELIAQFEAVRAETIRRVEAMTDADLDREGRHPFHGHGRLERFVRWAYEHAALHEAELRAAIKRQIANC